MCVVCLGYEVLCGCTQCVGVVASVVHDMDVPSRVVSVTHDWPRFRKLGTVHVCSREG